MIQVSDNYKYTIEQGNTRWAFRARLSKLDTIIDIKEKDLVDSTYPTATWGARDSGEFRIGTTNSATFKMTLENENERWKDTVFEGMKVEPQVGLKLERRGVLSALPPRIEWIDLGTFYVTSVQVNGSKITLECNDYMTELDHETIGKLTFESLFPMKLGELLKRCLSALNVEHDINTVAQELDYEIPKPDENTSYADITVRDVLAMAALLMGGGAQFNRQGKLQIIPYPKDITANFELLDDNTMDERVGKEDIFFSGLLRSDKEQVDHLYGDETGLVMTYPNGTLYEKNEEDLSQRIISAITGFKTTPFRSKIIHDPLIEPLTDGVKIKYLQPVGNGIEGNKLVADTILYRDDRRKRFVETKAFITGVTWTYLQPTEVSCFGTSVREGKRKSQNEKTIHGIEKRQKQTISLVYSVDDAQREFEAMVAKAKGLYPTYEVQDDGSVIRYEHDQPRLEDSEVIWKYAQETMSVSNDGGKTWHGQDAEGNQFAKLVHAQKIYAKQVDISSFTNIDGDTVAELSTRIRDGEIVLSSLTGGVLGGLTIQPNRFVMDNPGGFFQIQTIENKPYIAMGTGSSKSNWKSWFDYDGQFHSMGADIQGKLTSRIGNYEAGITLDGGYLDVF